MPILPGGQRRYLFEKSLSYLFSFDLRLSEEARIPLIGGVRFVLGTDGRGDGRDSFDSFLVYHVLDEERVEENDAVAGNVRWSQHLLHVPYDAGTGDVEGSLVIETTDHAIIDARFKGAIALGALGLRHFADDGDGMWQGSPGRATQARVFTVPRFDTAHPKYRWITRHQCAGFGNVDIEGGQVVRGTFDIYAVGAGRR